MSEIDLDDAAHRFLDLVDAGEPHRVIELAMETLEAGGVPLVVELLGRVQREVGERWHAGRYTVTQEHLASGVVDDVLGLLAPHALRPADRDATVAVVCAEGEWHTTPARMAALLLRDAGWRVQLLGASAPIDHLRASLRELSPQALAVSCTVPLSLPGAARVVDLGRELEVPVITGGRAFDSAGHRAAAIGADASFATIGEAVAMLDGWLTTPPAPTEPHRCEDEVVRQRDHLADHLDELVEASYRTLEQRLPVMADFDRRQRRHTREDLGYILRYADVALMVDDERLFGEFITWLDGLLQARGLPASVMDISLATVADTLGPELPDVRAIVAGPR